MKKANTPMMNTQKRNKQLKDKKVPMRRCVGCMESKPKSDLIRIASYEGTLTIDPSGKAKGRGVYICPSRECLDAAYSNNGLRKSLKTNIDGDTMKQLFSQLEGYER